jgi:hypothetical protein
MGGRDNNDDASTLSECQYDFKCRKPRVLKEGSFPEL